MVKFPGIGVEISIAVINVIQSIDQKKGDFDRTEQLSNRISCSVVQRCPAIANCSKPLFTMRWCS